MASKELKAIAGDLAAKVKGERVDFYDVNHALRTGICQAVNVRKNRVLLTVRLWDGLHKVPAENMRIQ